MRIHDRAPTALVGRASWSRLIFVNLHYHPDVASAGQHLQDLAEHLASRGHRVEVLSGRTSYRGNSLDVPLTEVHKGVRITRLRTPAFGREGIAGRLLGYALFLARASARLLFRRRDRVVFLTTPPLLPAAGYLMRRLGLGPPYAIWSMDLHPEAEVALGLLPRNGLATRALMRLDARAFRRADFVVALGHRMRERLEDKGVPTERVHVVPGWNDAEEVVPVPRARNPLVPALGLKEKFVVSYSGNAGLMHDFSTILGAMERLSHDPYIAFLFIGGGPRRPEIERQALERGLGNLRYLDYFPRRELRHSLSLGDVHLICLRQDAVGISVPGKLYGIMAVARPAVFVGPARSEPAQVIEETGCGVVIDPEEETDAAAALADTLLRLREDPGERRRQGERGRRALLERFDRVRNCKRLERLIRSRWGAEEPST